MKTLKTIILALTLAVGTIACSQEEDIIQPNVEFEQDEASAVVGDKDNDLGDDLENL